MSHAENAINSAQWAASRANDSAETVAAFSAEAQVYASLAVAEAIDRLTEQQRIANLFALAQHEPGNREAYWRRVVAEPGPDENTLLLPEDIRKGLGL